MGGALVALVGAAYTVVLDSISFLVSAMCLARMRPGAMSRPTPPAREPMLTSIRAGLRVLARDPYVRYFAVQGGMSNFALTGYGALLVLFLVKDLHLPWQWGARWFMQHLIDGDLASNNHGWQWAAGTGTDAAPYFRVFNPHLQQERYDPDGEYVARWVPDPVEPMLVHKIERDEALRRLASLKA